MVEKDTKTRILDAAEHLFAEHGFYATSMRALTAEAGVNLAAVNYHFGSKEALLSEVFGRRLGPLNADRLRRLDKLEAESGEDGPELEAVLHAFLLPPFQWVKKLEGPGTSFIKLAGRMHLDANANLRRMFIEHFSEVFNRFLAAIKRAVPELDDEETMFKVQFFIGSMIHTLAWSQSFGEELFPSHPTPSTESLVEGLVRYSAAGMRS